jgi:hypothetical protein
MSPCWWRQYAPLTHHVPSLFNVFTYLFFMMFSLRLHPYSFFPSLPSFLILIILRSDVYLFIYAFLSCYLFGSFVCRGSFPGGKALPGRDADNSPQPVPSSRINRSYSSSPLWLLHGGSRTDFLFYFCCTKWTIRCNVSCSNGVAVNVKPYKAFRQSEL